MYGNLDPLVNVQVHGPCNIVIKPVQLYGFEVTPGMVL